MKILCASHYIAMAILNDFFEDLTTVVIKSDIYPCADPESFVRGGPTLMFFLFFVSFLLDEGREDPSTTICAPSSTCQ